jgi:hypothetical protein
MYVMIFILVALFLYHANAFPMGKCKYKDCQSTPTILEWTSLESNMFCLSTRYNNDCNDALCCKLFEDRVNKFVFTLSPTCTNSISAVTIDGIKKGGGIYPISDSNGSELHLTNLRWNNQTASNHTICIHTKGRECDTVDKWCGINCRYSVYDVVTHACCPTCNMQRSVSMDIVPPPQSIDSTPPPHEVNVTIDDIPPPQSIDSTASPCEANGPNDGMSPPSTDIDYINKNICSCQCSCT